MTQATDYKLRNKIIRDTVDRMANAFQGIGPAYAECFPTKPRETHPAGALYAGGDEGTVQDLQEQYGRVSFTPTALGFKVNVGKTRPLQASLRVQLGVYYPVIPTHNEALDWLQRYGGNMQEIHFPYKYRRTEVDEEFEITLDVPADGNFHVHEDATRALQSALDAASQTASADSELAALGKNGTGSQTIDLTRAELQDPDTYRSAFDQVSLVAPTWKGEVHVRVVEEGESRFLEVLLNNATAMDGPGRFEPTFIGTRLTMTTSKESLKVFELSEIESKDYRYDATTWATGRNCYAEGKLKANQVQIKTDSVPVYHQKRLEQRAWNLEGQPIDTSFESLASDPLPSLHALSAAMSSYAEDWISLSQSAGGAINEPQQVTDGAASFQSERERFARGISALEENPSVLTAFQLMNKAFSAKFGTQDPAPGWRLFQLAFIVSELGDLVARGAGKHRESVIPPTVLWFPTGGGKTEAYLGLVVWHAFWDRLRGKPFGTVAFAKFPLRMLSLQQFARVVAVMQHADHVRKQADELKGLRGDPFSVGYYAGGSNSENLIDWPASPDGSTRSTISKWLLKKTSNPKALASLQSKHRKVTQCPLCTGEISTTFSHTKPGFIHKCLACGEELNLHVSDTEVLRWLPTLVIATVDKLARFASESWGRTLFGDAAFFCEDHGYLLSKPSTGNGCPILDCKKALAPTVENVDPVPSLLIQDELHVLSESLGAMDSHFETMLIETLRRKPGLGPWKIVGATATIEGYQFLVRQLYNQGVAIRFPCPGPNGDESFYARQSEEDQRYVMGVRAHGMSHVDATMKAFLEYHRIMAPVFDRNKCDGTRHPLPPELQGLSSTDLEDFGRAYRTIIAYGINRNEVGQVARSFPGQLNAFANREGLPPFDDERVSLLTGDTPIEELQEWLAHVENEQEPYQQAASVTSLFALGVDLSQLNMIAFRGMPHGMAEYIQAMSRVGRKAGTPSIVVNVYNPNRERDASYFETHKKFLEFSGVLIRHVPTTRFSKQALELTLPAVFMHRVNFDNPVFEIWKRQSVAGAGAEIRNHEARYEEDILKSLGIPYAPDPDSSLVKRQSEHVHHLVGRLRATLLRKTPGVNPMQEKAVTRLNVPVSLRSTDETIPIYSSGKIGGA